MNKDQAQAVKNFELGLRKLAIACTNDPLLFVEKAFRWGHGPLEKYEGPDKWQRQILIDIRDRLKKGETRTQAIQIAVASGHGIGKTAFVAWIILWSICTFPDMKGVVTAETKNQLITKTWSELHKWHNLCIFRDWFEVAAESIFPHNRATSTRGELTLFHGTKTTQTLSKAYTTKANAYLCCLTKPQLLHKRFTKSLREL